MSGKKLKRPSSARRNIKQETFSPFVSLTRLRNVQGLLSEPGSSKTIPDAVLCILGIDGRYNDGCLDLANYLLFSFFDARKLELERSGFEEEVVDDMMFVIKRESVDVFCNPINYHYLLPYMAHWKNLRIHCIGEDDYENEEKSEDFKIRSFISMVVGCLNIGIPYSGLGQMAKFDKMIIEKWPIVQAFALEEYGGGGFFTLKYDVSDMSSSLQTMYQKIDPVTVESMITDQLALFERQWNNMLVLLDTDSKNRMKKVTEGIASEPLKSYFNHGRMSGKGDGNRFPFVAFGKNTLRNELSSISGGKKNSNMSIYDSGVTKNYATHMICQAVSPKSPISCTRTYFCNTGILPHPASKNQTERFQEQQKKSYDTKLLVSLYSGCVAAVVEGIYVYANTLDPQQAEQRTKEVLQAYCQSQDVPLNPTWFDNSKNMEFKIEAFDNYNRNIPLRKEVPLPLVKTARITIYDIPSLEKKGEKLGSVAFAESFIESSIFALRADGSHEIDGEYMILTSQLERFVAWQVSKEEFECDRMLKEVVANDTSDLLGEQIIKGEAALLAVDDAPSTIVRGGSLYVYEKGVVFSHTHQGSIVIPKAELSAIHLYDGDSPSTVNLLILSYRENLSLYLPSHLQSPHHRLILAFQPKTKAYKQLTADVLPVWKEADEEPAVQRVEELSEELEPLHKELQEEYVAQSKSQSNVSPFKKAKARLPNLDKFIRHFCVSSVGQQSIPVKHVQACAGGEYDEGGFSDHDEMIITIIGGIPGSYKENLCQTLTQLTKEDSRWAVLKYPVGAVEKFIPRQIQMQVAAMWNTHRKRKAVSSKKMRVLMLTPGFTDIADVVQAIVAHPDATVAAHVRIGAVSVCVDPYNAFISDRYTMPKLLDQCAEGWVNNIINTSVSTQSSGNDLPMLLRAVNSNVAFLVAPKGAMTRSPDIDLVLSEDSFNDESLLRARYLSSPGWAQGKFSSTPSIPRMKGVALEFSRPLEKSRLFDRLKGLKSSHSKHPFSGNIYTLRGKVRFTGSDQLYEIWHVVLSGETSLTPSDRQTTPPSRSSNGGSSKQPQECCLVFQGCELQEDRLMDWMRGCAPKKPEKKVMRARKSLSRMEVNKIHKERHLESLPEGWFYNGAKFVSMAGDKSDTHPNLEEFLEDYLHKVNQEVQAYNAKIAQQDFHDLFE